MGILSKLKVHPAGLGLLVLGLLCWVIALGGIAACTNYCYNSLGASMCGRLYQVQWWAVWFEFFLLCVMLGTSFSEAFNKARLIYLCYLTMVTALLTISARDFITDSFANFDGKVNIKDYAQDARNAAAIGDILLCIVNFLLIIFVGLGASSPQSQGYGAFANQQAAAQDNGMMRGYQSSSQYQQSSATF